MVRHTVGGGGVGLVDVHAADGAAEGLWGCARVDGRAADRVVKDEDAGGAGAGGNLVSASLFEKRKHSKERGEELWWGCGGTHASFSNCSVSG